MGFYLEGTYIDDAYLRKKILDNDQVTLEKLNKTYDTNDNIYKKIGVEIEDISYKSLLELLENQFSDDDINEFSSLLNLSKTHIIAILYLLHEGRIGIKEVKDILHSTSYRTRGEALLKYLVENETNDIDIFKALKVECARMSNYTNPSEVSSQKVKNIKKTLEKIKLNENEVLLPFGAIYYMQRNSGSIGEKVNSINDNSNLSNIYAKHLFGADSFNSTYIGKFDNLSIPFFDVFPWFKKFINAMNGAKLYKLLSNKNGYLYFNLYTKKIYNLSSRSAFSQAFVELETKIMNEKFKNRLSFSEKSELGSDDISNALKTAYASNIHESGDSSVVPVTSEKIFKNKNLGNNPEPHRKYFYNTISDINNVFSPVEGENFQVVEFMKQFFPFYDKETSKYLNPKFLSDPELFDLVMNFDILSSLISEKDENNNEKGKSIKIINFGRTAMANMIFSITDLVSKKLSSNNRLLDIDNPGNFIKYAQEELKNIEPNNLPNLSRLDTVLFYFAKLIINNYLNIVLEPTVDSLEGLFTIDFSTYTYIEKDGEKEEEKTANDESYFEIYEVISKMRYLFESAADTVSAIKNSKYFSDIVAGDARSAKLISEMIEYLENLKKDNNIYRKLKEYIDDQLDYGISDPLYILIIKPYFPNINIRGIECLKLMKPLIVKYGSGGIL